MIKELLIGSIAAMAFKASAAQVIIELDTYTDTNGNIVTVEDPFLTLTIDEDQTNPMLPGMSMLVIEYEANLASNQAIQNIEIPFDNASNLIYQLWTTSNVGSGSSGSPTVYTGRDPHYEILVEFDYGNSFFQDGESGQLELYSFDDLSIFNVTDSIDGVVDDGMPEVRATLATFDDPNLMVWDDATQTMIIPQSSAAPEPSSALYAMLGMAFFLTRRFK